MNSQHYLTPPREIIKIQFLKLPINAIDTHKEFDNQRSIINKNDKCYEYKLFAKTVPKSKLIYSLLLCLFISI